VGSLIRQLARSAPVGSTARHYLQLVLATLEQQWIEGRRMAAFASLLWADPLLLSQRDVSAATKLQRAAIRSSRLAVRDVNQANELRKKNGPTFRYVRVRLAGAVPGES